MTTPDLFDIEDIVGLGEPISATPTTGGTRGPHGRFVRTINQAEVDAEAARLRSQGKSYRQIAAAMGCGVRAAHERVQRALAAVPSEAVEAIRAIEGGRLTEAIAVALTELRRDHIMVSHGRIVKGDDGVPLVDHGGKLTALHALVKASESYRKLMGADVPVRGEVKHTLEVVTLLDQELAALIGDLAESDALVPDDTDTNA